MYYEWSKYSKRDVFPTKVVDYPTFYDADFQKLKRKSPSSKWFFIIFSFFSKVGCLPMSALALNVINIGN